MAGITQPETQGNQNPNLAAISSRCEVFIKTKPANILDIVSKRIHLENSAAPTPDEDQKSPTLTI